MCLIFRVICSEYGALKRFTEGIAQNVPRTIGTFIPVEHYKRGAFEAKYAHELLVLLLSWYLKAKAGNYPYNSRSNRFYERTLLLEKQPERLAAFLAVDTADKKTRLHFASAIRLFSSSSTCDPRSCYGPATTTTPPQATHQALQPVALQLPAQLVPTYAEVVAAPPPASPRGSARRRRVTGQSKTSPTKVKRTHTRPNAATTAHAHPVPPPCKITTSARKICRWLPPRRTTRSTYC